jgi:hypothetical protein
MVATCMLGDIVIPGFGSYTFPRQRVGAMVIALDMAVVLGFGIFIIMQKYLIIKEAKEFNDATSTITDFAIIVKNLPPASEYQTEAQLKAMLTLHF